MELGNGRGLKELENGKGWSWDLRSRKGLMELESERGFN